MVQGEAEEATRAAKRLYELCDVAHKHNREPMVATGKYDVLNPLADCLLQEGQDEKLHFVCLTLNNLSIPHDNKRVMGMERIHKKLFSNLCEVIVSGKKEAYLCIICLMNLSYYEPAQVNIGQFSPLKDQTAKKKTKILRAPKTPPLENPHSLLRILQDLTAHAARGTADFRWAFGLLSSLAKHPENALLIGLTAVPEVALENIRLSKTKPCDWKINSLEDFSLFLILHLSETSNQGLGSALEVVHPIMKNDLGVQGLKATMICTFLDAPWTDFPNYGVIAAGCVSDLMCNTFEQKGKKGMYASNVFSMSTAVKAYGQLARIAVKADKGDAAKAGEEGPVVYTNTKVVALPTAVAMLLHIIGELVIHWDDGDSFAAKHHWDIKTGELAVNCIVSLLPALLEGEKERQSTHTEAACTEISQLMIGFSKKAISIPAKAKSTEAGEQIWEASKNALPLLEASFDLWKNINA